MDKKYEPLTDAELAQLQADRADKLQLLTELTEELDELTQRYNAEMERRMNHPGADVREFRPRNGPNPTDQGTC